MNINQAAIRLRDHLNGHTSNIYEQIISGKDLSKEYPQETAAWNNYQSCGNSLNESCGVSTKRIND